MIYENSCSSLLVGPTVKHCKQCSSKLQIFWGISSKDPDACCMKFLAFLIFLSVGSKR